MDDIIDLLQIKIEKAKAQLSDDTLNAINAVDWKAVILGMRERKGYSFEQLGDLELETELLLCGLLNPEDYPREIENRMKISKAAANELVNEMNEQVFAKIREEMIKSTERKKIFAKKTLTTQIPIQDTPLKPVSNDTEEEKKNNMQVLNSAGIEIIEEPASPSQGGKETLPIPEKLELPGGEEVHPILAQKLSGSFQIPTVRTEHSLGNITKAKDTTETPMSQAPETLPTPPASYPPKEDPYRLPPE